MKRLFTRSIIDWPLMSILIFGGSLWICGVAFGSFVQVMQDQSLVERHRTQTARAERRLALCSTDSDCAAKFGTDGGPEDAK